MSAASQARAFYRRERRKSLQLGDAKLMRTFRQDIGNISGDVLENYQEQGPYPGKELTVSFDFTALKRGSTAMLFQFGHSLWHWSAWVQPVGRIGMFAGQLEQAPPHPSGIQGWVRQVTKAGFVPFGLRQRCVASVRPGDGTMRLWLNGVLKLNRQSSAGVLGAKANLKKSAYSHDGHAVYGVKPFQAATLTPASVQGDPAAVTFSKYISIFESQRPQHYNTGPQIAPIP